MFSVNVVKYLVELAEVDTLNSVDANNNSLLHYACQGGNLWVIKYLLEANVPSVSERNNDNKLAIHLLFECGSVIFDRESMEYVETVWQLLLTNPEVVWDFMSQWIDLSQGCMLDTQFGYTFPMFAVSYGIQYFIDWAMEMSVDK